MSERMNGRQNERTIELAMQLREELLQLPSCELYGIMNCKNKAILLTREKVIRRDVIVDKIEKATTLRDFYLVTDKNHILVPIYNERINTLKELLEGRKCDE